MAGRKVTRRQFVQTSAAAAAGVAAGMAASKLSAADKAKIINYNENMEYRPCGKTGMVVSAVAMGGHWKRIEKVAAGEGKVGWLTQDINNADFQKNRYDVVTRCMERGINWIDACTIEEVKTYARAIKGRRDKMYLACSWYQREMRIAEFRTEAKLMETLEWGLKDAGIDYADLWRITMHEQSNQHTDAEVEEMMKALAKAKKQGKVRFTGFSSHHRDHIKGMIEKYPEVVDAFCTPYHAKTKEMPTDSLFETVRKYQVGIFGIKPFSSNSLFNDEFKKAGDNPPLHTPDTDRLARLAIRYILCNPTLTAPIPGLINEHQVDNVAKAVMERRKLDANEKAELDAAMDSAWASLPPDYQWLKNWEYV
ncbi:MAG TPA: aldo/keto reductase [Phycisphaerae bacterium]|nr:aldo/keto reductase [Phycisphaerae bacterium]